MLQELLVRPRLVVVETRWISSSAEAKSLLYAVHVGLIRDEDVTWAEGRELTGVLILVLFNSAQWRPRGGILASNDACSFLILLRPGEHVLRLVINVSI